MLELTQEELERLREEFKAEQRQRSRRYMQCPIHKIGLKRTYIDLVAPAEDPEDA